MTSYHVEAELLRQYISRIEKIEEEKARIQEELKDTYLNAKNHGFDIKALKQIIKLRKMDSTELIEQETLIDVYKQALGMSRAIDSDEPG